MSCKSDTDTRESFQIRVKGHYTRIKPVTRLRYKLSAATIILETTVGREKDVQDIDVHGEF